MKLPMMKTKRSSNKKTKKTAREKKKAETPTAVEVIPIAKEEEVTHHYNHSLLVPHVSFGAAWMVMISTLFKILVLLCSLFVRVGEVDEEYDVSKEAH